MPEQCPTCKHTWMGEEVVDGLMSTGCYSLSEAVKAADSYGWTPENHNRFHDHVLVVKAVYSQHSFWLCLKCKTFHHWTGEDYTVISQEEVEEILHPEDIIALAHWHGEAIDE